MLKQIRSARSASPRRPLHAVRGEQGSAVVEFAVLVPVLLLIVFGIVDFGRAMNYKNELTQLANEAARFAAVNKSPVDGASEFPDCSSLKSYLSDESNVDTKEIADMIGDGTVAVTVGSTVGEPVTVELTTSFSFLPFLGGDVFGLGTPSASLSGQATMRLEQVPTFGGGSC